MRRFVVDASVAVKWFVPEIHSAPAARLLDPDVVLLAPDLITAEFGNTVWKKVRRAEITRDEAGEIVRAFGELPLDIHRSAVLLPAAFQLAVEFDRSIYDSLYLSLAVAQKCILVTADAKFHSVVSATPVAAHIRWIDDQH